LKKKILIILGILLSILLILIVALKIYFALPVTVLKIKSEDGKYTISVEESGKYYHFALVRYHEYTLIVKKRWFIFNYEVDRGDFSFSADASGIDSSCVDIEWHDEYAIVTIDSPEMTARKIIVSLS